MFVALLLCKYYLNEPWVVLLLCHVCCFVAVACLLFLMLCDIMCVDAVSCLLFCRCVMFAVSSSGGRVCCFVVSSLVSVSDSTVIRPSSMWPSCGFFSMNLDFGRFRM